MESATLVIIDLDGLKKINDAQGHSEGDAVLRRFAAALAIARRESDLTYRWGGDEYALLMPEASLVEAERVMSILTSRAAPLHSWGAAVWPRETDDWDSLISMADGRMYAMKRRHKYGVFAPLVESLAPIRSASKAQVRRLTSWFSR